MWLGALEYRTRRCRRCGPDADARLGSHFLGRGIQQPEWSGLHVEAVMEAVSVVAPVQQVIDPNDPLTLEEAEQRLNALLSKAELNAWDVGDLLNKVERRGLARASFGKTKSWVTQRVLAAEGKMSTLYRYANVAATYTKE